MNPDVESAAYIEAQIQNEELRRTQFELANSLKRYSDLYDLAPVGYLTLNARWIITEANLTAAAMLGTFRASLTGRPLSLYILAEDQDAFYLYCRQLLATRRMQRCELRILKMDGAPQFWVQLESVATEDSESGEWLFRVVVSDISDRKKLEDDVFQALEAARNTNATMGRLMRTVAHEFRTPLGLLTGSADILDRYWDRLTFEQRFDQNENIRSATRQISGLINSMISFNLSGNYNSRSASQQLDIGCVCAVIAAEVETACSEGHLFNTAIAADCGTALLDEHLFRRVLENLLSNAFRYTPPDGAVSLHVSRDADLLLLEVTDSGIGIPEEEQALIFDAFFRAQNVEGRRGLGLGLSIVRETLEKLGGTIELISSSGNGTAMKVKVPVTDPAQNQ